MKNLGKRGLALLLTLVMCLGMLDLTAFAAGTGNTTQTIVADASTINDWTSYFTGRGNGYGGGADAGYIWTDKTVQKAADNNSFDITYSALGSAEVVSAVDLVLVLDISGSMGDPLGEYNAGATNVPVGTHHWKVGANSQYRMSQLIPALNSLMEKFMAQSRENRISIVVFDSSAYVLLPLDHYTKMAGAANYITAERHHWQRWGNADLTGDGQHASTLVTHCVNSKGATVNNRVTSWSNTNLMAGIGAGIDILKNRNNTSVTTSSGNIGRTPVMVVMTDGAANTIVTNRDLTENDNRVVTGNSKTVNENLVLSSTALIPKGTTSGFNHNHLDGLSNIHRLDTGTQVNPADLTMPYYDITNGLTIYAGGNRHMYGSEDGENFELVKRLTCAYANSVKSSVPDLKIYSIGYDLATTNKGYGTINPSNLTSGVTSNNPSGYNNGYWDVKSSGGTTIDDAFTQIYNTVSTGTNYPTVGGLTYTDTLGKYMVIGDTITINGTIVVRKGANGRFNAPDGITIRVTESDPQTLTITIADDVLPVYTYANRRANGATPITFTYNVKLKDSVQTTAGKFNPAEVDAGYAESHTAGSGKVFFLSNRYEDETIGAKTTFTPSDSNDFYNKKSGIDKSKVDNPTETADKSRDEDKSGSTVTVQHGNNGKLVLERDPMCVSVTITKHWFNDIAAFRPESITVTLTGSDDSTRTVSNWTKDDDNNKWTATVNDLPTYDVATGAAITYTVAESDVPGYVLVETGNDFDIAPASGDKSATLANKPEAFTSVTIKKVWVDPKATDDHAAVTVKLYGNDADDSNKSVAVKEVTLSAPDWSATIDNLPRLDGNGDGILYTVEETLPEGYTVSYSDGVNDDEGTTITVTNTIKQERVNINGDKTWKGTVPEGIVTVTLTGTVDGKEVYKATTEMTADNAKFAFPNVPKYDVEREADSTGKVITYKVSDEVSGFSAAVGDVASDYTVTLVNTREDIDDTIEISATKIWDDETNANNTRTGNEVFVLQKLVGDNWVDVGEPVSVTGKIEHEAVIETTEIPAEYAEVTDEETGEVTQVLVSEAGTKTEVLKEAYTEITNNVSVTFGKLPKYDQDTGAVISYQVVERNQATGNYTTVSTFEKDDHGNITGTITNTLDGGETSVPVTKVWRDPYTDATGNRPAATVTLTGTVDSAIDESLTKTYIFDGSKDEQDYTFENLPVYKDGHKIVWSVDETTVPAGYTKTPAHTDSTFVFINTIDQAKKTVSVRKAWELGDLGDDYLPNIEITLTRKDGEVSEIVGTITGNDLVDGKYTWNGSDGTGLDVYNLTKGHETGHKWVYSVDEKMTGTNSEGRFSKVIDIDEAAEISDNDEAFVITNTFDTDESKEISGRKLWKIPNNAKPAQEQIAAVEITVRSTNHTEGHPVVKTTGLTIEENGTYTYKVTGLPKYDAVTGEELEYVVEETGIPAGFTSEVSEADHTTITNRSEELGKNITLRVSKSWFGPEENRPEVTIVITGSDGSSHELKLSTEKLSDSISLPKYDSSNNEIKYSVAEQGAENGKIIIGGLEYNVEIKADAETPLSYTVTNTLAQNEDVAIKGEKKWTAIGDEAVIPAEFVYPEIQVQLYINGKASENEKHIATLNEENEWEFDFGTLPKYALAGNGVVDATNGYTISYEVREVGVTGKTVTFTQEVDGKDVDYTFEVTTGKAGDFNVTNAYRDSQRYYFELVTNYVTHMPDGTTRQDGTNVQAVGTTEGKKGQEITAGDLESMFPADQWTEYENNTYTFDADHEGNVVHVKLENAGPDNVYRLVLWYERTITPTSTITTPNYTSLTVNKVWNVADGVEHPASVTVQLYRSGIAYGAAVTLNEGNGWSNTWDRLDASYDWTVNEINVPEGYTATVSQNGSVVTITNTYGEPEIPDEPPPLTDIPDEDPPQAEPPKEPEEEIPDEDVPLSDVPETGDNSTKWFGAALMSAFGLAILSLFDRKKRKEG